MRSRALADIGSDRLRLAAGRGEPLDAAGGRVRAADLRRQLREPADPRGLRLRHAVVDGPLDLSAFELPFPLAFEHCTFTDAPNVEGADLHSLELTDCTLPGLLANGVHVRRDINLSRSAITSAHHTNVSTRHPAAVWMCEAVIGGRLLCFGTSMIGDGGRGFHADRLRVGGSARFLEGFTVQGEMRMLGAHIEGSLEFGSVTLENPDAAALLLSYSEIISGLFITGTADRPSSVRGQVVLTSARVGGGFFFRFVVIDAPADPVGDYALWDSVAAVDAARLSVDSDLVVAAGTVLNGELSLPVSDLGGLVFDEGARLNTPGGRALDLTNAEVRSRVDLGGQVVRGRIRMPRAHIQGRLYLGDATLSDPEKGVLFDGYGLHVEGNVEMPRLRTEGGQLVLVGLIAAAVHLRGARLTNPDDHTVNLRSAKITGNVFMHDGFRSEGFVSLDGARIEGRFSCHTATFDSPGPTPGSELAYALTLFEADVTGGTDLRWDLCRPSAHVGGLTTLSVNLAPANWPELYRIGGFRYERLSAGRNDPSPWNVQEMCDWLDGAVFDAGAYEHAAHVFTQHGYSAQAETILIRGRGRAARNGPPGVRRAGDWLFGKTVGYGYRPGRALIALAALLFVVLDLLFVPALKDTLRATDQSGAVYTVSTCADGRVRCFNQVFFAVDTVVPLVSLNQRATWYPDVRAKHGLFLDNALNVATLLGWILSTIVVLSFARLARST